MLTKEQKIKLIADVKKGEISKEIIQFTSRTAFAEPNICNINSIEFNEADYKKIFVYLKSLGVPVIEVVNMSKNNLKSVLKI